MRAQIKARMEELSAFYDANIDDDKVHFVEKLRLKLKRALFNRPGKQTELREHSDQISDFDAEDVFDRAPLSQQEAAAWDNLTGSPDHTTQAKVLKEHDNSLNDVTISSNEGPFEVTRPTELVFRVKLTSEEYEMYMRERFLRMQNTQGQFGRGPIR